MSGNALYQAVSEGDLEEIRSVLTETPSLGSESIPDLDEVEERYTAMHWAAKLGKLEVISLLSELGCSIHALDHFEYTPVAIAAQAGQAQAIKLLHELGANVNTIGSDGYTPAHAAVVYGRTEALEALLELGANIHTPNKKNCKPIFTAGTRGNLDLIKLLLKHGADINEPDSDGYTPLMRAAHFGKTNPVSVLLDLGAPLSRGFGPVSTAQVGLSARAIAQQRGHTQVVERIDQVLRLRLRIFLRVTHQREKHKLDGSAFPTLSVDVLGLIASKVFQG
eukprot:c15502_g1_i1.p1 GENE.c15502_g1_i1~~c15502_g1_i1.p1  ORF type:complete len:279 (+),score=42.53 c15502_g1_i1:217-1053(+)